MVCLTSRVQMDEINLHENFISDLLGNIGDISALTNIVAKYGTHYYTSADMGGKLTIATSTSQQASSVMSQTQLKQSTQASFSAKVSGWGFNADAAGEYAASIGLDTSTQASFEGNSTHSSVMSYGGAPGSFGPQGGAGSAPNNWADWAGTVDLLPIPVNYQVDRVYNLLATNMNFSYQGFSIPQQWQAAEIAYYEGYATSYYSGISLPPCNTLYQLIGKNTHFTLHLCILKCANINVIQSTELQSPDVSFIQIWVGFE